MSKAHTTTWLWALLLLLYLVSLLLGFAADVPHVNPSGDWRLDAAIEEQWLNDPLTAARFATRSRVTNWLVGATYWIARGTDMAPAAVQAMMSVLALSLAPVITVLLCRADGMKPPACFAVGAGWFIIPSFWIAMSRSNLYHVQAVLMVLLCGFAVVQRKWWLIAIAVVLLGFSRAHYDPLDLHSYSLRGYNMTRWTPHWQARFNEFIMDALVGQRDMTVFRFPVTPGNAPHGTVINHNHDWFRETPYPHDRLRDWRLSLAFAGLATQASWHEPFASQWPEPWLLGENAQWLRWLCVAWEAGPYHRIRFKAVDGWLDQYEAISEHRFSPYAVCPLALALVPLLALAWVSRRGGGGTILIYLTALGAYVTVTACATDGAEVARMQAPFEILWILAPVMIFRKVIQPETGGS